MNSIARPQRKLGAETAKNRAVLIGAAERLLCEDGYDAVTARKVANKAGLKVPLVYYYFQTMDDLILEVIQKNIQTRTKHFVRALSSGNPIKAIWELSRDNRSAISTTDLIALANHREAVSPTIVAAAKYFRALQIEAVDRYLEAEGVDRERYPAGAIVTMVVALARAISQDCSLGVSEGYDEAVKLLEQRISFILDREIRLDT